MTIAFAIFRGCWSCNSVSDTLKKAVITRLATVAEDLSELLARQPEAVQHEIAARAALWALSEATISDPRLDAATQAVANRGHGPSKVTDDLKTLLDELDEVAFDLQVSDPAGDHCLRDLPGVAGPAARLVVRKSNSSYVRAMPHPPQLRRASGAVVVTCLVVLVLCLAAGPLSIAIDANMNALLSFLAALMILAPTLIFLVVWIGASADNGRRGTGNRAAMIAVSLIAAAGILVIWLTYPLPGVCDLVHVCDDDPRLKPSLIGTVVIAGLWAVGMLVGWRSAGRRPLAWLSLLADGVVIAAAVFVPVFTLAIGGFSFPWW